MSLILHINSLASSGCVAMIARSIVNESAQRGYDNVFAYGRGDAPDYCKFIRIGNNTDFYEHVLESRLLDDQGKGSRRSTRRFIEHLNELGPDVVHLHNIHGSYLNYVTFFSWLAKSKARVIWTLHDCWAFTGHCSHYDYIGCDKWKSECRLCPRRSDYPKSWIRDRSTANFRDKKSAFTSIEKERMQIVTPSKWLASEVGSSFLGDYSVTVIPNGIDFAPASTVKRSKDGRVRLLAVASKWHDVKGLSDLRELSGSLDYDKYALTLVGSISDAQKVGFSDRVCFVGSVAEREQMAYIYATSDVFLNLTHEDNFPTVNIEALRSGLPIITYGAGGSGEAQDEFTGRVVPNVYGVKTALDTLVISDELRDRCIARGMRYTAGACANSYCDLYSAMVD